MGRYLYDYHIHSNFSTDGKDSIYQICRDALDKGLKEIAITDHFEPTVGNEEYKFFKPADYLQDLEKARELFKGRLTIKAGIELGQPHRFQESSRRVLNEIPFDFVLGSAHKFPGDIDCSEIKYADIRLEDICSMYLKQLEIMANDADFDCVGHIDLIKRYSKSIYSKRVSLTIHQEFFSEVLKILIRKDKGIEINTSGLRQKIEETMPGLDTLLLYKELGGKILTVGSDAHYANHVGEGIQDAIDLAMLAGFDYLTVYNKRNPEFIKIDGNKDFYYYFPDKLAAGCI